MSDEALTGLRALALEFPDVPPAALEVVLMRMATLINAMDGAMSREADRMKGMTPHPEEQTIWVENVASALAVLYLAGAVRRVNGKMAEQLNRVVLALVSDAMREPEAQRPS